MGAINETEKLAERVKEENNQRITAAIADAVKKGLEIEKLIKVIENNRSELYKWERIENHIVCCQIQNDAELLKEIKNNFREGMILAVFKKYLPALKSDIEEIIKNQVERLK